MVDDDALVLAALCAVLRKTGYQVISAESGAAAVAFAREFHFDLALCDRQMPGMDGIELLEHLRALQPMCSRVLLTGGLDLATTISAVNRGAITCVLEKPIKPGGLLSVVGEALSARRRMVEAYETMQREHDSAERQEVRELLTGKYIQLAVQPIVRASSDPVVFGHEALLRSTHPTLNSPAKVLPAVERQKMIDALADIVVREAVVNLEHTSVRGFLFINLHPAELGDPDILRERLMMLKPHAGRVIFEITERSSLYGVSSWEQSVEVIRGLGFEIAVDDLGAGYSALSILAELKPRYMKVDMSIIRDCDRRTHKQRLIDLLCRFAEATDSLLVAEGIETEAEAATVRDCGAHLLQGYLFGRPRIVTPLYVVAAPAAPVQEPSVDTSG